MRFDTGDIDAVIAAIEDDRVLDDALAECTDLDDVSDRPASTEPDEIFLCFARGSTAPDDDDPEPEPRDLGIAVDGVVDPPYRDDERELGSEPSVIVDPGYLAPRSRLRQATDRES